jgi:hypothetical protein
MGFVVGVLRGRGASWAGCVVVGVLGRRGGGQASYRLYSACPDNAAGGDLGATTAIGSFRDTS